MKITGTVSYQSFEMGFWGIVDDKGNKWMPVNLPNSAQIEGKKISFEAEIIDSGFSFQMWGQPIKITTLT